MKKTRSELNQLSQSVLDSAYKIHTMYGPGLLENAYEAMLVYELAHKGHVVRRQPAMPLIYEEIVMNVAYRLDILVDEELIIELKSVEKLTEVHHNQLITYLKLADKRIGLLINFNVSSLKDGIFRKVNNY